MRARCWEAGYTLRRNRFSLTSDQLRALDVTERAECAKIRENYRIGQRLRPCPGCAECDPYMSSYGSFYGGDPRRFTPDEECSTEQERELHRKHCDEWANGERPTVKVSGVEWVDDITYKDSNGHTQTIKAGHKLVERAAYGLGVSRLTNDPDGHYCDGHGVLPAKKAKAAK